MSDDKPMDKRRPLHARRRRRTRSSGGPRAITDTLSPVDEDKNHVHFPSLITAPLPRSGAERE